MNTASEVLSRSRAVELTPERFRRVAAWAVGWLILIIATGATVRLTGSGLGCRHWPGCQPSDFLPQSDAATTPYVEFGNRVVASLTVLTTLVLAIASLRTRALARNVKVLAWLVFAGTLAQAPLGAITIHYDLNPWLVLTHLLVSLVVLGLCVVVLLEAARHARGGGAALPARVRAIGALLFAAVCVLVVTGTLATAAGPHPRQHDGASHRLVPAVRRVTCEGDRRVRHRVSPARRLGVGASAHGCRGSFAAAPACSSCSACRWRSARRSTARGLPWWLVLIHVTIAACVFAWTVGLVARLWRPVASKAH